MPQTCHPVQRALLEELGVPNDALSQTWGSAAASAGFHEPEGTINGKPYSSCFDIAWYAVDKDLRDRLVAAGVCVFPRDWDGNQHHHCVQVGLTNDAGKCCILPGPRQQIVDFIRARSGLAGHGPWRGQWPPTASDRKRIAAQYAAWVPDVATRVYLPDGTSPTCYAWLAGDTVKCEVRPLVEALGWRIIDATFGDGQRGGALFVRNPSGGTKVLSMPGSYVAGEFLRAPVREIAKGLGLKPAFEWAPDHTSCKVVLS